MLKMQILITTTALYALIKCSEVKAIYQIFKDLRNYYQNSEQRLSYL